MSSTVVWYTAALRLSERSSRYDLKPSSAALDTSFSNRSLTSRFGVPSSSARPPYQTSDVASLPEELKPPLRKP